MVKCYLHGEQIVKDEDKPSKPLTEHPGWDNHAQNLQKFRQDLEIVLKPSQVSWEQKIAELDLEKNSLNRKFSKKEKALEEEFQQKNIVSESEKAEFKKKLTKEKQEINNKLNQLIARVLNISEKPTGTFSPELTKEKGIKELLERFKVKSLEELVVFVDKVVKKNEGTAEMVERLQKFLKKYSVADLNEVEKVWKNTEKDYLTRIADQDRELKEKIKEFQASNGELLAEIERLKKSKKIKGGSALSEEDKEKLAEYDDLITERDELAREKKTLEQQNAAQSNQLKNKQQEVNNKDKTIEKIKKEASEKEISLNRKLTENRQVNRGSYERINLLTKENEKLTEKIKELDQRNAKMTERLLELEPGHIDA